MTHQTTCWTVIEAAAAGGLEEKNAFAHQYEPLIRAYLGARWRGSALAQDVGDACQEFFVDCFREGGPLTRAERERAGGFRPFLYGIARIIALRWEEKNSRRQDRPAGEEPDLARIQANETHLSQVLDRAWSRMVLQQAAKLHQENAEALGEEAIKRVELLNLRFREGLPIREIANLWDDDPARLHREYSKARDEFSQALFDSVSFHYPDSPPGEIQQECLELLNMLQ